MSIQFTKASDGKVSAVRQIKTEVADAIEGAGMPRKLYIQVHTTPPEGEYVEAAASLSQKDGRVMYNFGGKSSVKAVVGRLQGNFFLPKDGWTVDPSTLKAYQEAKAKEAKALLEAKAKAQK